MRTAFDFRLTARKTLFGRYWLCVFAALIAGLLGGAAGLPKITLRFNYGEARQILEMTNDLKWITLIRSFIGVQGGLSAAVGLAIFIIGGAVEQGYDRFCLDLYTDQKPEISTLFCRMNIFGKALCLRLLIALRVFLWGLLLVIPGIVAAYRYAMAAYAMAEDPSIGCTEAIERSKALMRGHKARLFFLHLSFIGWYLLAALTVGIGLVFLGPYVKAAETAFYLERTGRI